MHLLHAEVHRLRGVQAWLGDSERARQLLANKMCEAKAKAQSCVQLLQRAADLKVDFADARDLNAELKARVSKLETSMKELKAREASKNLERNSEESMESLEAKPPLTRQRRWSTHIPHSLHSLCFP